MPKHRAIVLEEAGIVRPPMELGHYHLLYRAMVSGSGLASGSKKSRYSAHGARWLQTQACEPLPFPLLLSAWLLFSP